MGLNIKKAIQRRGFTSKQVAEMINISTVSFSNMINGNPTVDTLYRIANAINVDIIDLIDQPDHAQLKCPHCGNDLNVKIE